MVKVLVRDNKNIEKYISIIRKKRQKEGIQKEEKKRKEFIKPTTQRKLSKAEAKSNERKRQRKERLIFGF